MEEWQYQLANAINTIDKIKEYINLTLNEEEAIKTVPGRWGTTPYFTSLMDKDDQNCPIRRQIIPSLKELESIGDMTYNAGYNNSFLRYREHSGIEEDRPSNIARQYRDRVALTVTNMCGIYCRHCFRREETIEGGRRIVYDTRKAIDWIRNQTEIHDVLITGGDPLIFSDNKLKYIIESLRDIPHIRMVRIGSRMPVVNPFRITDGLMDAIGGYHEKPIWLGLQINHPKEITYEIKKAVYKLTSNGIVVYNQSVLLKGVNDDAKIQKKLNQEMIYARIKPYYLYHCEPAPGVIHFQTDVEKGIDLIKDGVRGHTTGLAHPHYVCETPIGKIVLSPNYIEKRQNEKYIFRGYDGRQVAYENKNI